MIENNKLSTVSTSKSDEERLKVNNKRADNSGEDVKDMATKNVFLPSTESALKTSKVQANTTESNNRNQGNDRLLLQKGFSKLSLHAMASIESKRSQHDSLANIDDKGDISKSTTTSSTFSKLDMPEKSVAKDAGGFDFHAKDYNANSATETSARSSTFMKVAENEHEISASNAPDVRNTTRTTDTSERQMTLEERIESMLNKSKSNGMTGGNKSKAEDTNFGDEADVADLLS